MEAAVQALGRLRPIAPRRRRADRLARWLLVLGALIALVPLVLILVYLVQKGIGHWSPSFFTSDPQANILASAGGIAPAIVGTLIMVGLATLIAVPIGIAAALYLVEYARTGWFGAAVRYFTDVMTGVPSIVFGLFVYVVAILTIGHFAAWAGAIALALLMLPIVIRSSEVVLTLVPGSLREAALALGAPRWRVTLRVVLPTAFSGILTGVLLAIARASGETAPLLFTALNNQSFSTSLNGPMAAMPTLIFSNSQNAFGQAADAAWGTALTLVVMIVILTLAARLIARRRGVRR